jgi:hypothetical protein
MEIVAKSKTTQSLHEISAKRCRWGPRGRAVEPGARWNRNEKAEISPVEPWGFIGDIWLIYV